MGDLGSLPGSGRSPGEGNGFSLQYSGLENSMDCVVHGVTKSQTRLSNFHSLHQVFIAACGLFSWGLWDLVPWRGMETRPPAFEVQSLSHWTTREVPVIWIISFKPVVLKILVSGSLYTFKNYWGPKRASLMLDLSKFTVLEIKAEKCLRYIVLVHWK